MRAVRVNGQITQAIKPRFVLRVVTIWQPQFLFRLAEKLGKFAISIGISKKKKKKKKKTGCPSLREAGSVVRRLRSQRAWAKY